MMYDILKDTRLNSSVVRQAFENDLVFYRGSRSNNIDITAPFSMWQTGTYGGYVRNLVPAKFTMYAGTGDHSNGPGARSILCRYLDGDYAIQSEIVIPNGGSARDSTTVNCVEILDAYITSAGTGNSNEGDVRIVHASGVYNIIQEHRGRCNGPVLPVPAGYEAWVTHIWACYDVMTTGDDCIAMLVNFPEGKSYFVGMDHLKVNGDGSGYACRDVLLRATEKSVIEIRSMAITNNNQNMSAGFCAFLQKV